MSSVTVERVTMQYVLRAGYGAPDRYFAGYVHNDLGLAIEMTPEIAKAHLFRVGDANEIRRELEGIGLITSLVPVTCDVETEKKVTR